MSLKMAWSYESYNGLIIWVSQWPDHMSLTMAWSCESYNSLIIWVSQWLDHMRHSLHLNLQVAGTLALGAADILNFIAVLVVVSLSVAVMRLRYFCDCATMLCSSAAHFSFCMPEACVQSKHFTSLNNWWLPSPLLFSVCSLVSCLQCASISCLVSVQGCNFVYHVPQTSCTCCTSSISFPAY